MPTPILEKESLIPGKTSKLVLHAPAIASHARPGHFVMLRMSPTGERIPLTIADTDAEKGTITIVYLVMGKSTAILEDLKAGDEILDVCGPLGKPTHIEKKGTVICVGGGTGIAAMHHIAKGHSRIGNKVVGIIGARNKDLLLFEKELASFVDELLISTDDGSYGHKGLVTDLLRDRLESDKDVFEVVAVGLGHIQGIRGQVLGAFARNDGAGHLQILLVMGVDILGVVRLNKIVALLRQDDVRRSQNAAELLMADDTRLLVRKAAFAAAGKIAAVMHDTDIIGIDVVRRPVQARQLAEICVALRDIVAGIIADIAAGRVDGMAHLYRKVHRVIRHPVRFMRCYDNGGLQCVLPALHTFLYSFSW